ncbi:MAG TPA: hypothetical protein VII57_05155 [Dehalococcoidia bacterium]
MSVTDPIQYLRSSVAAGDHWYLALLKTMARWDQAEEVVGGRRYRYLIGGEAFDWLLLAERLVEELDGAVSADDWQALLFHGRPPLELDEEEFQTLIGTPKYQAYLNYLYGVVVEEALQLAVEEEIAKEQHAHVWSAAPVDGAGVFQRIYGRSQPELLREFQEERGLAGTDKLDLDALKEFTYWLFKRRVKTHEGARVASDTRKGLAALSRVEAAFRKRTQPDAGEA